MIDIAKTRSPFNYEHICGIYYMKNHLNGKMYIGQSQNIWERIKEHYHHHKKPLVDKDLYENRGNFEIGILCYCKPEELDYYEQYYINLYDTLNNGYNQTFGGKGSIGETNPTNKLSEEDVYNIREDYKNHIQQKVSYEKYKDKVTFNSFQNVWQGQSWPNIHYDVYTEENKIYYKTGCFGNSEYNIFTDDEVIEMRTRYINESAKQIYDSLPEGKCSYQTLQQILFGRYYKHLPVYNKRLKIWTNS